MGITIEHDLVNHHIYLSQATLINKILASFNMIDCNAVLTPMEAGLVLSHNSDITLSYEEELELLDILYCQLVSLLMYLVIATHPDISLAVQKLSQFMTIYQFVHWNAAK